MEDAAKPPVTKMRGTKSAAAGVPFADPRARRTTKPKVPQPVALAPEPPVAVSDPVVIAPVEAPAVAPAPVDPAPVVSAIPEFTEDSPPAAVPAFSSLEEDTMASTFTAPASDAADKAATMFADVNDRAKGAMEKGTKAVEELTAFGKGNVEAIVESSKIAAKGFELLGQDAAEYTRKSFENATAAIKTLATVKSPTEFLKLQGDFMRSAFDSMVAETSRSTETVMKLAGEVAQPISTRMAIAADKMKISA